MKFIEIAASDDLTQKMAREVVAKSPLLAAHIHFFKKPGSAVTYRTGGASDGIDGQTRALGADYAKKTVSPTYKTAGRKMLGDTIRIDVAHERMGYDIPSEMAAQLTRRVREMGYAFNYALIKGDAATTATQFDGLEKLVVKSRIVTAAANGLLMVLGNSDEAKKAQQEFLGKVDELIALCEGTNKALIGNARTLGYLNAIAREYLSIERNEFGVPVVYYNQTPVINAGDYQSATGTYSPIIGFDETVGTATKCASMYCASFEEEDGLSFATCEGGFMVYPIQKVGNFYECTYELIADSALVRASGLSKLEGLKQA